MKALFELILVIALSYLAQFFLPWWGVIIAAAFAGLIINNKGGISFLMGFFGVAILWFLQAYMIDSANESILSEKVAGIFTLSSGFMMMIITALIGGICGGLGALAGKFGGDVFRSDKKVSYYN
jgi:hypothetical protein